MFNKLFSIRHFGSSKGGNPIKYDYLTGFNSVHAAIYNPRREKTMLYLSETEQTHPKLHNIVQKANSENIPVKVVPKNKLSNMSHQEKNQNIVLQCMPVPYFLIHEPSH